MSQDFEFEVINRIAEFEFVRSITPMSASDKGYASSDTIHPRYEYKQFNELFDEAVEGGDDEYPAVYQIDFISPEEIDIDFDTMMNLIEEVVRDHPNACIGNYDSGVPQDDFSGWDIDPIVDVLCVQEL